jgi:hypothetical protein
MSESSEELKRIADAGAYYPKMVKRTRRDLKKENTWRREKDSE